MRTVATALAHPVVDDDAPGRIGVGIALAPPALFGRAGLVVNEHRDATEGAQAGLHPVKGVAMQHIDACGKVGDPFIFSGVIGHDHHLADTLGRHLSCDHRHRQGAVNGLAARHRYRVVKQDLVGDIDFGRDSGPKRKQAGMVVSTVAQVGKHVLLAGKRGLPDPRHALAAHLRERFGIAVHPAHHVMAADSGQPPRSFRNPGGGVVRTAGAKPGLALSDHARLGEIAVARVDPGQTGLDSGAHVLGQRKAQQPQADGARHDCR